jgi:GNAT superfamily N-acetyltransferase
MIRALRPTDALAYVSFYHRLHRRPATGRLGRVRLGADTLPVVLGFFGRSLALEPGREAWVQIDHGRIWGLVAAKRREGADVWDVDHLAVLPSPDSERVATRLLEHLLAAAADDGIQKVFMRLDEGDPAQEWIRRVGFSKYCDELTFARAEVPTFAKGGSSVPLRGRRPADHQPLFQLYCSAVPFRVRQAEAMTLREWRWMDGWAVHSVGLGVFIGGRRSDYVYDVGGRIAAWLQVDRGQRRLVLLDDARADVDITGVLRYGLSRLGSGGPAFCVSRDYQVGLARALDDNGFAVIRREALFARGLAARVPELKLVPIRAS